MKTHEVAAPTRFIFSITDLKYVNTNYIFYLFIPFGLLNIQVKAVCYICLLLKKKYQWILPEISASLVRTVINCIFVDYP